MRNRRCFLILLFGLLALLFAPAWAADRLPVFDTHFHYSERPWRGYPPARVAEILKAAGVPRALVSSTPDDQTLRLHALDPVRFVAELSPYRGRIRWRSWTEDAGTPAYLRGRIRLVDYRGIGEFHLNNLAEAGTPVVKDVVTLAAEHDLWLHIHATAATIRRVKKLFPEARILWAHAGWTDAVSEVARLMADYPDVITELSLRAGSIAPKGTMTGSWRELLLRYPGRFTVGSDPYTPKRAANYAGLIDAHRVWLAQLPGETARRIAYGNAVRLFGDGGIAALGK